MKADRLRIEILVLCSVLLILVVLLRQIVIPIYLLMTVLFSYYAALGMSFLVFWALDPQGFNGIDWKVAIFLFHDSHRSRVEDYNIFLLTRVFKEEQHQHGPLSGIAVALTTHGTDYFKLAVSSWRARLSRSSQLL